MTDSNDNLKEQIEENFIQNIQIEDVGVEAKSSYMEYALSVIVDRALPDARDGLKPVHRRILYAMNVMGITHTNAYKKSARIVGDVIGKYHPHGDTAVYDSMVRMAQPFSMRVPLIDGQGSFGSVDGEKAAAMRYTEARMGVFSSKHMFNDLGKDTVKYIDNYDGSEIEPTVLPLKYPNLIINGVQGIAVGMASNIPPHNPIEAMEVVKYKVLNKINGLEDSIDELIKIMPAPDFPTSGHIHGLENIKTAWTDGFGKLKLRCKWTEKEISGGRTLINIIELPYQVKKEELVSKLGELIKVDANSKIAKIEGVLSAEDASDKKGVNIEIILKNEADPEMVMNEFLRFSDLEKSISYNCTVLTRHGDRFKPENLGLNELFEIFIKHRLDIILKRSIFDRNKLAAREHILNGLKIAVDPKNIDNLIATIKSFKELSEAKLAIMDLLNVDEIQAQEILQIRLSRLVGLEIEKIDNEISDIIQKLLVLNTIIDNEEERYKVILVETEDLITEFTNVQTPDPAHYKGLKYPFRDRLSSFQIPLIKSDKAALTKEEECNIIITSKGFMRKVPLTELSTMNRGARGKKQIKLSDGDFIQKSITSHSHDSLLFITNTGKVYTKAAYDIPDNEKGSHVNFILDLSDRTEKIIEVISVDFEKADDLIAMFTKKGLVKLSKLSEYAGASRKGGIKGITLREDDSILCATLCNKNDTVFMVNDKNLIIRFSVDSINVVGRGASGVKGMRLDKDVSIVGAGQITNEDGYIVCVSKNGLIKITKASQYRTQTRGGKGFSVMKTNERSGLLFNSFFIDNLDENVVSTTKKGYSNSIPLNKFNVTNRTTSGVKLLSLDEDDILVDVFNSPFSKELEELDLESENNILNLSVDTDELDEDVDTIDEFEDTDQETDNFDEEED